MKATRPASVEGLRAAGEPAICRGQEEDRQLPDPGCGPPNQRQAAGAQEPEKGGNLTKDEFNRINRKADKVLKENKA